ncbi:MAG: hypothetical protein GX168_11755 [Bacteroidales bacterium]|nr:hypothetical protein [Bacteroidales bacterium]
MHGATHSSTPQLLNTDFLSVNISAFISEHQWKKWHGAWGLTPETRHPTPNTQNPMTNDLKPDT